LKLWCCKSTKINEDDEDDSVFSVHVLEANDGDYFLHVLGYGVCYLYVHEDDDGVCSIVQVIKIKWIYLWSWIIFLE
jgi:hypothetical protein